MRAFGLLSALCISSASALSFDLSYGRGQAVIQEEYKVPGKNPLYFCQDPVNNTFVLQNVDLDPNPPKAGATLSITANGKVTEKIEEGAKVHLQVKLGLITLVNQETDLCEQSGKADINCPIEKGNLTLSKDVKLPDRVPPGTYTVLADVYTKDKDRITCLTAKVHFDLPH